MDGTRFPSQIANRLGLGFSSPLYSTCITFITMHNTQPARLFQHNKSRNAWEIFHSKTPDRLEFEKKVPKCPLFLWLLSLKDPLFFACIYMFVWGECCSEAGKFCILETESCNLVNTFWCIFDKGDETKISVRQAQPTQLCIMDEFHGGGEGWYTGYYPLVKHGRGYILHCKNKC